MLANVFRKNCIYIIKNQSKRQCSVQLKEKMDIEGKMKAWQVHSYGEDLVFSNTRIPIVHNPNHVLIKVEGASVNPIDTAMQEGYGRNLLQVLRKFEMELPLTLGRDFCGTIVGKGLRVNDKFKVGDRVYGFIPVEKQGSFAEYVIAEDKHICHPPDLLKPTECASIVYTSMTAWSALFLSGNLINEKPKNLRVLILGASGGVGTTAIQILKAINATVIGTCSLDAIPLVTSLGIDKAYDYKQQNYLKEIAKEERFHIILDCAKFGPSNIPSNWKYKTYVGLNSSILSNVDEHGLIVGNIYNGKSFLCDAVKSFATGKNIRWGFFAPSNEGFTFIDKLVHENKIRPIIQREYNFAELSAAMNDVKNGHLRGKIVVNYS